MKTALPRVLSLFAALGAFASVARAVPVSIDVPNLRAIQVYNLDKEAEDDVYLLIEGIAKGADVSARLPKDAALKSSPKKPPVGEKSPASLWTGDLADGEYAFLTVTLVHGTGKDAAKVKEFTDKVAAASKAVPERLKKTLTADEAKALAKATVKAQQPIVKKVGDTLSREKGTDHFGGLFNILVRNDGGKVVKRLDPVGLTFGEHYGNDLKTYTKLKYTRTNVLVQDGGEWSEQQLLPLSDDEKTVRVKMLETEMAKAAGRELRHTTDYVADVQVKVEGKPAKWKLGGENLGPSDIHTYYDYAE